MAIAIWKGTLGHIERGAPQGWLYALYSPSLNDNSSAGRTNRSNVIRDNGPGARISPGNVIRDEGPGELCNGSLDTCGRSRAGQAGRWARGEQDPRLIELGDRWFENDHGGRTFMHLPTRAEVLDDLAATGWTPQFDAMRRTIAPESAAVRAFSDECRFWLAQKEPVGRCPPC
jgi:hypothetical protein